MDAIKRIQEIDVAIAADAKTTQVEYSSAMKKIQTRRDPGGE